MEISPAAGDKLLLLARRAIDNNLAQNILPQDEVNDVDLKQKFGCFVTIKMNGRLRGCIGTFVGTRPLYQEVAHIAICAATTDPRFPPMVKADAGTYSLDISVLSPRLKIDSTDQIVVGKHGIYLENADQHGVLLPQVAVENNWQRQSFLEQTCIKAGLPRDAWQLPETKIYIFSAQIISD